MGRRKLSYPKHVVRGPHIPEMARVKLDLQPAASPLPIALAKARAFEEWRAYWGAGEVTLETIDRFAREFRCRWRGDHLNRYEYLYLWAFEFIGIVHREQLPVETQRQPLFRSGRVKRFIVLDTKEQKRTRKKKER
jgi:hypothetical protein